jgi:hypothetical protein
MLDQTLGPRLMPDQSHVFVRFRCGWDPDIPFLLRNGLSPSWPKGTVVGARRRPPRWCLWSWGQTTPPGLAPLSRLRVGGVWLGFWQEQVWHQVTPVESRTLAYLVQGLGGVVRHERQDVSWSLHAPWLHKLLSWCTWWLDRVHNSGKLVCGEHDEQQRPERRVVAWRRRNLPVSGGAWKEFMGGPQ